MTVTTIYRREVQQGSAASGSSRFVWNEVMYQSFRSGYLKRLDWSLYTSLESPVAKRLYRFLDKRFYNGSKVEIDLRELAVQKVRLSEEYNTAQMKRVLLKGIEELESRWDLKRTAPEKRFVKEGKGQWVVILERKAKKPQGLELNIELPIKAASDQMTVQAIPAATTDDLAAQLVKRGIGPASADGLTERQQAFSSFWEKLNPEEQERFETKAIDHADPTKRTGYLRSMGKTPSPVFEQYRMIILRDYFERQGDE